jgi:hypothetical protein
LFLFWFVYLLTYAHSKAVILDIFYYRFKNNIATEIDFVKDNVEHSSTESLSSGSSASIQNMDLETRKLFLRGILETDDEVRAILLDSLGDFYKFVTKI